MQQGLSITPKIRPASQCAKTFQTRLSVTWPPALPAIAINSQIIVGFERTWVLDYNLDGVGDDFSRQWQHVFTTALPSLTWVELLLWTEKALAQTELPLAPLWQHYGFRDLSSYEDLASFVLPLPLPTLEWLKEKKVGPHELQVLKALKTDEEKTGQAEFWPFLQSLRLSRQEGIQALELWTELRLLGHDSEGLRPLTDSGSAWVERLKKLRYPETQKRDSSAQAWVESQIWPRPSQIRWMRHGDQTGLEIRLIVKKPGDLGQTRQALEDIESLLAQAPEGLWPKH